MSLRHVEMALQGVETGIRLRAAIDTAKETFDERARRQTASQVGEQSQKDLKAIDAPMAEIEQRVQLYGEEVQLGKRARDPQFEATVAAEGFMARSKQAEQKLNYAMNTIAAHPDNEYIQKSFGALAQTQMDVFGKLKDESMQMDQHAEMRKREANATSEREATQNYNTTDREDTQSFRREEIGLSRDAQKSVAGEQDRLQRGRWNEGVGAAASKEKGGAGGAGWDPKDMETTLKSYRAATDEAALQIEDYDDEELSAAAKDADMSVSQYKRAWTRGRAMDALEASGMPPEQLKAMKGLLQEGPLAADEYNANQADGGEDKPADARAKLMEVVKNALADEGVADATKARLKKILEQQEAEAEAEKPAGRSQEENDAAEESATKLADALEDTSYRAKIEKLGWAGKGTSLLMKYGLGGHASDPAHKRAIDRELNATPAERKARKGKPKYYQ